MVAADHYRAETPHACAPAHPLLFVRSASWAWAWPRLRGAARDAVWTPVEGEPEVCERADIDSRPEWQAVCLGIHPSRRGKVVRCPSSSPLPLFPSPSYISPPVLMGAGVYSGLFLKENGE